MKILIIQTAFIGDVVLATALVEKLHEVLPDAHIDFLVRKGNESLLQHHPYLHEVLVWNKKEHKQRNLFRLVRTIRQKKYDKVINVQRFAATGILTALSGAAEKVGFKKNPFSIFFSRRVEHDIDNSKGQVHEIDRNQQLIAHFAGKEPAMPRLYPSSADRTHVDAYTKTSFITVSPASVWFTKQFPAEQWISFLQKLPPGLIVFLLGAPSDKQLCDEIASGVQAVTIKNLAGQLSFLQSAALMQSAGMNYANDSAPMHFASAMNAPVTAVFCSTVPSFGFGPLSQQKFIVEINHPLYCRPCGLHGYKACPEGHFKCAKEIKDEQLLASLQV